MVNDSVIAQEYNTNDYPKTKLSLYIHRYIKNYLHDMHDSPSGDVNYTVTVPDSFQEPQSIIDRNLNIIDGLISSLNK